MIKFSPDPVSLVKEISSGDSNVYIAKVSEEIIIAFRLPPYPKITKYLTLLEIADTVVETNDIYDAIFNSYAIDNSILNHGIIPAGIPESIVKLMFYLSGFQDTNNSIDYTNGLLDTIREQTRTYPIDVMKRTICAIFTGYTFDILEKMDLQELYRIYVNAEQLGIKRDIIEEELRIVKRVQEEPKAQSLDQIIKSSNRELHNMDNTHERVNIRDTERWQKSYTNTSNKLKR